MKLSRLFQDKPQQWGLRGDPYLWDEMAATLKERAYPATEQELAALLEQTYAQLTGAPLSNREPVYVERYSHGGMSSGYVSPQFWAETAIPMLIEKHRKFR
jgi:hypothetical protein